MSINRFIPEKVIKLLGRETLQDIKPGDVAELIATVAFIDIRNFTELSESMPPGEVVKFLNNWYGMLEPLITAHDGYIDKYVGDAVLAVFTGTADQALKCSKRIVEMVDLTHKDCEKPDTQRITVGIGLNSGVVAITALGSTNRLDVTVIGDTVNTAARLEALTKTYGVNILISEHTYIRLSNPGSFDLRFLDRMVARGKKIPLSVYEAFGGDEESRRIDKARTQVLFEQAIAWFHYGIVNRANEIFQKCLDALPNDGPTHYYLQRCEDYKLTGSLDCAAEMKIYPAWSAEFSVGHSTIDKHHQKLFEVVSILMRMIDRKQFNSIDKVVDFLGKYIDIHFRTEEHLMKSCNYVFYEDHKSQHDKFAQIFKMLIDELKQGNNDEVYTAFRIRILIVDWLLNHTTKSDPHLAEYLSKTAC